MLDYGPIETTKTRPKLPELYNSNAPVRKTAGRSIRIAKKKSKLEERTSIPYQSKFIPILGLRVPIPSSKWYSEHIPFPRIVLDS